MAWIEKYKLEFYDLHSIPWKISFLKTNWPEGSVITLKGGGTPITHNFLNESDEVFDPIKETELDLSIVVENEGDRFAVRDICSTEQMKTQVKLYQNNNSFPCWRGYVDPGQYEEPYDVFPYDVKIICIDGLVLLKDILFADEDSEGAIEYYNGRTLESEIILNILGKIGYTQFREFINLYEEEMLSSVNDSPFDQVEIDVDVFEGEYCIDVLKEILKKYNACIRQYDAIFSIYRPKELIENKVYGRHFTDVTTKTSYYYLANQFIDRLTQSSIFTQVPGGQIIKQFPMRKNTIHQDYGNRESLIDNWEFKGETFDGTNFTSWTQNGAVDPEPFMNSGESEKTGVKLNSWNAVGQTKYLYQSFGERMLKSTDPAVFEFDYLLDNYASSQVDDTLINVMLVQDDYYLTKEGAWVLGPPEDIIQISTNVASGSTGWLHFKVEVQPLQYSLSAVVIRLYPTNKEVVRVSYKEVKFFFGSQDISKMESSKKSRLRVTNWGIGGYSPERRRGGVMLVDTIREVYNTEKIYSKINEISGKEINYDCILGDVVDSGIDNVLEQFAGSLAISIRETLAQAATNFDTDHSADYSDGGVTVGHSGNDITFTAASAGTDFTGNTSITNTSGDLTGSVENTTANAEGQKQIDIITLGGTTGTADITCNGLTREASFSSSLEVTAQGFVSAYASEYLVANVVVTSNGGVLTFTESVGLGGFTGSTAIVNTSGDLSGIPDTTQSPTSPTARVDTITLSGGSGTANITCDGETQEVAITETLLPSVSWWKRQDELAGALESSGNLKSLLDIIIEEIAEQYSRAKYMINMPIQEITSGVSTLNVIGNIQDDWTVDDSDFPVRNISAWTLTGCTLALSGNYVRYTSTDVDSIMLMSGLKLKGSISKIINIRYRVVSGSWTSGQIFYGTILHGRSASFQKNITLDTDGEWHIATFDMSDLTAGGTDWIESFITDVWFDLTDQDNVIIDLDWIGFSRIFVVNRGSFVIHNRRWNLDLMEIIR